MTPCGVAESPSGGSGRLVTLARKNTLSPLIAAPRSEGGLPPMLNCQRDSPRVSSRNNPSPSPTTSPSASATRKVSSCLSAKSPIGPRGSALAACSATATPVDALAARAFSDALQSLPAVAATLCKTGIDVDIVSSHDFRGKTALEYPSYAVSVETFDFLQRLDRFFVAIHDEARNAMLDHLGYRSTIPRDHRGTAGHRFDHHQTEGLRPVDREQQRCCSAKQFVFLRIADFSNEVRMRARKHGLDDVAEIGRVDRIDLGGDLEQPSGPARHVDRAIGALLRGDAADKRKITIAAGRKSVEVGRQTVVDRRDPACEQQRFPLVVRNRYQRVLRPPTIGSGQVLDIEAAVQRRHGPIRAMLEEREMDHVDVKMQHIELIRPQPHFVQHRKMRSKIGLERRRIEPDRLVAHCYDLGARSSAAAREQGDVMPKLDQGVGEMRDDPLGSSVELRRNGFVQRRDLGDSHSYAGNSTDERETARPDGHGNRPHSIDHGGPSKVLVRGPPT